MRIAEIELNTASYIQIGSFLLFLYLLVNFKPQAKETEQANCCDIQCLCSVYSQFSSVNICPMRMVKSAFRWLGIRLGLIVNFLGCFSGILAIIGKEAGISAGLVGLAVSNGLQASFV